MSRFVSLLERQLFLGGNLSSSVVDNILAGKTYYRKTSLSHPLGDLSYYLTILDTGAAGFSYFHGEPMGDEALLSLVDQQLPSILDTNIPLALRVSLLDAACEDNNKELHKIPSKTYRRTGDYHEKAQFRAQLLTKNIKPGSKVLMVGLVTEFLNELLAKNDIVQITDMSPELKDTSIHGIDIIGDEKVRMLKELAHSDYALVTGAVFTTNTIDEILEVAHENHTKLYFYLETGSSFAPYLIDAGVSFVLAEKFPFYDLPGRSTFEIYE